MNTTNTDTKRSVLPLVGRVLLSAIFIISGLGKIAAPEATQGYIASVGLPAPLLGYLAAIAIELGGGLLLLVGFRTRVAAVGLAAFSIISAIIFHSAFGDQNQLIHFLKNLAMAGGLIHVAAFGAGAYSIDDRKQATRRPLIA